MTGRAARRARNVLLVRLDSMGDVLLTGGAVRAVAAGADRVTMLVAPGQQGTAAMLPGVDEVIGFDAGWVPFEPRPVTHRDLARTARRLRRGRFSAALVFTSFHQSPLPTALLLRMAGVPWIGAICVDYPGSLLDVRHRVADGLPEAERNLSLAVAAGFEPDADGARLAVRRPPPVPGRLGDRPYVVFHPGAAVPARRPSPERSRAMVAALVEDGWTVVVTGGPDEAALTHWIADITDPGGATVDLGGRLGLRELSAVLAGARVVVAPNTGPAHLAAAVGTPIVSLFAPVVPAIAWKPYGVPVITLGDQDAPCRGTRARQCPVPGHPCLDSISPRKVVAAVNTLTTRRQDLTISSPTGAGR